MGTSVRTPAPAPPAVARGLPVLARNVSGRLVNDGAGIAARIVLALALARIGDARDLGLLVLTSTIAGLALLPAASGLDVWTAVETARRGHATGAAVPTADAFRLCLLTSGVVAVVLAGGGIVLGAPVVGVGAALLTLFNAPGWVIHSGFAGAGRLGLVAWGGAVEGVVALGVGLTAVAAGGGAGGAVAGLVVGRAANLAVSAVLFARRVAPLRAPPGERGIRLLRQAIGYAPMRALVVGLQRVDTVVLGVILGTGAVGIYGAATNVTLTVPLFATAVVEATLPRLVRDDASEAVGGLVRICALLSVPITLAILVGAPWLVGLAYGPGFEPAVTVLRILALSIPLVFVSAALAMTAVAQGAAAWRTAALGAAVITNVAVNLTLIGWLGVAGVAWATLVAEAVYAGVLLVGLRRTDVRVRFAGPWSPRAALRQVA